jgi:hypothetical protein
VQHLEGPFEYTQMTSELEEHISEITAGSGASGVVSDLVNGISWKRLKDRIVALTSEKSML